jgi:hypothetical protein
MSTHCLGSDEGLVISPQRARHMLDAATRAFLNALRRARWKNVDGRSHKIILNSTPGAAARNLSG